MAREAGGGWVVLGHHCGGVDADRAPDSGTGPTLCVCLAPPMPPVSTTHLGQHRAVDRRCRHAGSDESKSGGSNEVDAAIASALAATKRAGSLAGADMSDLLADAVARDVSAAARPIASLVAGTANNVVVVGNISR